MKRLYGGRIWTDYYHKNYGVSDVEINKPCLVKNISDLNKIYVGYLSGLVNYYDTPVFRKLGTTLNYLEKINTLRPFIYNARSKT